MKNQTAQEKADYDHWENKRRSTNSEFIPNKAGGASQQQSQNKHSATNQAKKQQLAVVNLDIGKGQTAVIELFQGDDIIKVMKNFCEQHGYGDDCVVETVRQITRKINSAQSKELKTKSTQQQQQDLIQDQQQSIQSSEKEDIQSQTTNSSSKQNYLQFNPQSPGLTNSNSMMHADQFQSASTIQSQKKSKEGSVKNVVEKGQFQDEEEIDNQDNSYEDNNNDYEMQRSQQQYKKSIDAYGQKQVMHSSKSHKSGGSGVVGGGEDTSQIIQRESQELYQSTTRHASKSQYENGQGLKSNGIRSTSQNYLGNQEKQPHQQHNNGYPTKSQEKMQENFEKWNKFIKMKSNLNAKSREDLKCNNNIHNNNHQNNNNNYNNSSSPYEDKRARSQSQRCTSPSLQATVYNDHSQNPQNNYKSSQVRTDRRNTNNNNNNNYLDEYQIVEQMRSEGLLPDLARAKQKMVIGNVKVTPKPNKQTQFLTSGSSGQPSSSSSSFTEKNLKQITNQLSHIEEVQNSSLSQNTSRMENNLSSNSLMSSFAPNYLSNSAIHNSSNMNKHHTSTNEDLHQNSKQQGTRNNQKTPTRSSTNKQEVQVSPISSRNSTKNNFVQQQQQLSSQQQEQKLQQQQQLQSQSQQQQSTYSQSHQSLQKRVQGIVPLLDIKKAQLVGENNNFSSIQKLQTPLYSQTSRSPKASASISNNIVPQGVQTQRESFHEENNKMNRGNFTDRDQKQSSSKMTNEEFQNKYLLGQQQIAAVPQKQKVLLSSRVKQQSSPDNNGNNLKSPGSNSVFNVSQMLYAQQKQIEAAQKMNRQQQQLLDSKLADSLDNSNNTSQIKQTDTSIKSPKQDNILKIDLETYSRQKKVLPNPPLTDRTHKRDEQYNDYYNRNQLDKTATELNTTQPKIIKNPVVIQTIQAPFNNLERQSQRSPLKNNKTAAETEKHNLTYDSSIQQQNNSQAQKVLSPHSQIPSNNSFVSNPNNTTTTTTTAAATATTSALDNFKKEVKKIPKAIVIPGVRNSGGELISRQSPPHNHQHTSSSSQQQQQSNQQFFPQNELLVNRLQRQKEVIKPALSVQQPKQIKGNPLEFQEFLYSEIFQKMDGNKDGFVSIEDVIVVVFDGDILTILQDFLLELEQSTQVYSFVNFQEFIYGHPKILNALKEVYIKKYSGQMNNQQSAVKVPSIQNQQIQQQIQLQQQQQQIKQNQTQFQSVQNYPSSLPKQEQIIQSNSQQFQSQLQQQQIIHQQQQQKQQQLQPSSFNQSTSTNSSNMSNPSNIIQQNNQYKDFNRIQSQQQQQSNSSPYQPIQQQINQFNENAILLQQSQQQQQQSQQLLQQQQQSQQYNPQQLSGIPNLQHDFSFQPNPKIQGQVQQQKEIQSYIKQQQQQQQQQPQPIKQQQQQALNQLEEYDDEDEEEEDVPITHYVDLSSHLKKKNKDNLNNNSKIDNDLNVNSHFTYNNMNNSTNLNQQNIKSHSVQQGNNINQNKGSFGNIPSSTVANSNMYLTDNVNFSFCDDSANQQRLQSHSYYNQKNNLPVLNNLPIKDCPSTSQNHSPSFHDQTNNINNNNNNNNQQNLFEFMNSHNSHNGTSDYNQQNVGQDLLMSFSNQNVPYREPSFGNNQNQYSQFQQNFSSSSSSTDPQAQQQLSNSNQVQTPPPQIISGRYKNLVQKQFNINSTTTTGNNNNNIY